MNVMQQFKASYSMGVHTIEAVACFCGADLVVVIGGGERYHVGAVAIAVPRASLRNHEKISASASVICLTGHKEDLLAREGALRLASKLNRNVILTIGIHVENATADDLQKIKSCFDELLDRLVQELGNNNML